MADNIFASIIKLPKKNFPDNILIGIDEMATSIDFLFIFSIIKV